MNYLSPLISIYLTAAVFLSHLIYLSSFHGNIMVSRKESSYALHAVNKSKQSKSVFETPEFSRKINVAKIPSRKPALCKLLANEIERANLSNRLGIPGLNHLSANVTISRQDSNTIIIEGILSAIVYNGDIFPKEEINCEFDTILLDNTGSSNINFVNIDDAKDYDDEVSSNGDIDIGEIVSQFLSLELF